MKEGDETSPINIGKNIDDGIKIYELFRDYIKHEDDLINQRLTWLLTIHGFLYATCGFTLQKRIEIAQKVASDFFSKDDPFGCRSQIISKSCIAAQHAYFSMDSLGFTSLELDAFLFMLALVGFTISLFGLWSIQAAMYSSTSLRRIFAEQYSCIHEPATAHNLQIFGADSLFVIGSKSANVIVPSIAGGGSGKAESVGFVAPNLIPKVLIVGWGAAIIFGFIYICMKFTYIWRVFV